MSGSSRGFATGDISVTDEAGISVASEHSSFLIAKDNVTGFVVDECNTVHVIHYPLDNDLRRYRTASPIPRQSHPDISPESLVIKLRSWLWSNDVKSLDDVWKHLYIMVNPYSGVQNGSSVFYSMIQPMLRESCISYDYIFTERNKHGTDVAHSLDLSKYDAILIVSGDGLVHELVNGLLEREDGLTAIKTPIAIVSNGTGNCLAAEVLHQNGDLCKAHATNNSIFHAVKGVVKPMDLMRVTAVDKTDRTDSFAFLQMFWGMMADIEFESVTLRKLGQIRYDLYAIKNLLQKRVYSADVFIKPVPKDQWPEAYRQYVSSKCTQQSSKRLRAAHPDTQDNEAPDWVQLPDKEYTFISLNNMRFWGLDMVGASMSNLDDGIGYLLVFRKRMTRRILSRSLLGLATAAHESMPNSETYCVRAVRLQPHSNRGGRYISIDGEEFPVMSIQCEILPSMSNFIC